MNHDEKLGLKIDNALLEELTRNAEKMNRIPLELYQKYSVKRGLRNDDGTGVLVGLTEIGYVHGYIIDEGQIIPVDGRLEYRGININDITGGFQTDKRYGFEEVCYLLLSSHCPRITSWSSSRPSSARTGPFPVGSPRT